MRQLDERLCRMVAGGDDPIDPVVPPHGPVYPFDRTWGAYNYAFQFDGIYFCIGLAKGYDRYFEINMDSALYDTPINGTWYKYLRLNLYIRNLCDRQFTTAWVLDILSALNR